MTMTEEHGRKRNEWTAAVPTWVYGLAVLLLFPLAVVVWMPSFHVWPLSFFASFSDADVRQVKSSIKAEFEKRPGVIVTDVEMLRENPKKLVGFAKIKIIELGGLEIAKSCDATWFEDGKYLWRCE